MRHSFLTQLVSERSDGGRVATGVIIRKTDLRLEITLDGALTEDILFSN